MDRAIDFVVKKNRSSCEEGFCWQERYVFFMQGRFCFVCVAKKESGFLVIFEDVSLKNGSSVSFICCMILAIMIGTKKGV